jgi:integrase/recombinase XerD
MPRKYHHVREPLSRFDANRLANECKTFREKLVIWTLLDTGLRVEEFVNLDKRNIDWSNHAIVVWGKNTRGGEKKQRKVPISDRVRPLLEGWLAQNDCIGFTTKTAWEIVRKVAHRCAIGKCSPHVLRHTFAVESLEKGISLPSLQKVLGHENLETTAIYLDKSSSEAIREYREKF